MGRTRKYEVIDHHVVEINPRQRPTGFKAAVITTVAWILLALVGLAVIFVITAMPQINNRCPNPEIHIDTDC